MILFRIFIILLFWGGSALSRNTASDYFEQGNVLSDAGKVEDALIFYRAAVRLQKNSTLYQYKLGETEFLLNRTIEARRRFQSMLTFDPNYFPRSIENITNVELEGFITEILRDSRPEANNDSVIQGFLRKQKKINEIDCSDNIELCTSTIRNRNEPFILRGALHALKWNLTSFDFSNLLETFGTEVVDLYPQNMIRKPEKLYPATLREAIDFLEYPEGAYVSVDASLPGTYIQWNLNRDIWSYLIAMGNMVRPYQLRDTLNDFVHSWMQNNLAKNCKSSTTPQCTDAESSDAELVSGLERYIALKLHWNMILIGEEDSGMFNHKDSLPVGSWQAQIFGHKRWNLCSPTETPFMYSPGAINTFNPDFVSFPLFAEAQCEQSTVMPGDIIYYPAEFWHQTLNLQTPSLAISGSVEMDDDHSLLTEKLTTFCAENDERFSLSPLFCGMVT